MGRWVFLKIIAEYKYTTYYTFFHKKENTIASLNIRDISEENNYCPVLKQSYVAIPDPKRIVKNSLNLF